MNNRKINKLINKIKNISVYNFEGENYVKTDDFIEILEEMGFVQNVRNNRTNSN